MIDIDWCDGLNDNREPKKWILEVGYDRTTKYYFYTKKQAEKYYEKYKNTDHISMYRLIKRS